MKLILFLIVFPCLCFSQLPIHHKSYLTKHTFSSGYIQFMGWNQDTTGNLSEYPKGFGGEFSSAFMGKLSSFDYAMISSLYYDKNENLSLKNISLSFNKKGLELYGGDAFLSTSPLTFIGNIRGASFKKSSGDYEILSFLGKTKEKSKSSFLQIGYGIRMETQEVNKKFGITYVKFEDDEKQGKSSSLPILSEAFSMDSTIPLPKDITINYEYGRSIYSQSKKEKDEALLLIISSPYKNTKLHYEDIGENFKTEGNTSLISGRNVIGASFEPAKGLSLGYEIGSEKGTSIDKKEASFEITKLVDINLEFEEKTKKKESRLDDVSLKIEKGIKDISIGIGYSWQGFDNKKDKEQDYTKNDYSLTFGMMRKMINTSCNFSFLFLEEEPKKEKTNINSIFLSASFYPIKALSIEANYDFYDYRKTKTIYKKSIPSILFKYSLSKSHQLIMGYEYIKNKDYEAPENNVEVDKVKLGFSVLF